MGTFTIFIVTDVLKYRSNDGYDNLYCNKINNCFGTFYIAACSKGIVVPHIKQYQE